MAYPLYITRIDFPYPHQHRSLPASAFNDIPLYDIDFFDDAIIARGEGARTAIHLELITDLDAANLQIQRLMDQHRAQFPGCSTLYREVARGHERWGWGVLVSATGTVRLEFRLWLKWSIVTARQTRLGPG